MITAKKIEKIVKTGALHVLYREDGGWYHQLKKFPGVLFDDRGYVIFETKEDYKNNKDNFYKIFDKNNSVHEFTYAQFYGKYLK